MAPVLINDPTRTRFRQVLGRLYGNLAWSGWCCMALAPAVMRTLIPITTWPCPYAIWMSMGQSYGGSTI